MVGNDVIDLQETRRSTNWERPRWLQKVFTPKEQVMISASNDPFTLVWKLWSIKESAYKVHLQAGGQPFLDPTKINCHLETSTDSTIKVGTLLLNATTTVTTSYIFSTAQLHDAAIQTGIFLLEKRTPQQQSSGLQQRLLQAIATKKHLELSALRLQKTSTGVPQVYCNNQLLPIACSLTHHGSYGAYSMLGGEEPPSISI